jgi:DMSO/TMAO reductase YedYZ molybdopterin-dependent catalytic subunit
MIRRRNVLIGAALALLPLCAPAPVAAQAGAQAAPAGSGTLKVTGEVRTPLSLSPDDLKAMPRKQIEIKDEDGKTIAYEGVLVGDILKRAGAKLGSDMRGQAVATYVVAGASDGYQVVFSLAELDPVFTGSEVIVADTIDGKPLFSSQGPLRIVAPRDARAARSIRMLERLEVVQLKKQ